MFQQQVPVEVVGYDPKHISVEELGKIFYKNYKNHLNVSNFTGVYHSMKFEYGTTLTHIIYVGFALISASLFFFMSKFFTEHFLAFILSLMVGIACCYLVFAQYFPHKIDTMHSDYGRGILQPRLANIKANFQDKGGNFFIALVENPLTGKKEVAGHVAFRAETREELRARGADEKQKIAQLEMMGVSEEYRGLGVARKLIQTLLNYAEKNQFDVVELGVIGANYPAVELYKKLGFKITKEFSMQFAFKSINMEKRFV